MLPQKYPISAECCIFEWARWRWSRIGILYVHCSQEKAKAEHRDKLGERDDTIPPKYQHLLDDNKEVSEGGVQGKAMLQSFWDSNLTWNEQNTVTVA